MADIHEVMAKVRGTEEPFSIRVEFPESAEIIEQALEESEGFKDVSRRQEF